MHALETELHELRDDSKNKLFSQAALEGQHKSLEVENEKLRVGRRQSVAEMEQFKNALAKHVGEAESDQASAAATLAAAQAKSAMLSRQLEEAREEQAHAESLLEDAQTKAADALKCAAQRGEQLKKLEEAQKADAATAQPQDHERTKAMNDAAASIGKYVQAEKLARAARSAEKELRVTLEKLVQASDASEGALTCMSCMHLLHEPVTCAPCGHTTCKTCVGPRHGEPGKAGAVWCRECGEDKTVDYVMANTLAHELTAKYTFQKQAIAGLLAMGQNLRDICEGGSAVT